MTLNSSLKRSLLVIGLVAVGLFLLPFVGSRGTIILVTEIAAILSIAMMWNLLAGFGGMVFMGFQVFVGMGGYALFLAANGSSMAPFPFVLVSAVVCAGLAFAMTPIVFRLKGAQLAIGSWVISEIVRLVVYHTQMFGAGGGLALTAMRGVPREIRLFATYGTAVAILLIALLTAVYLMQGRFGLALRAIRDNDVAAEALGVDLHRVQTVVLAVTAAIAGAAGGAYYLVVLQISPTNGFSINWMAIVLFVVILGGIGTLEGPIIGVVIYFLLRETLGNIGSLYFILLGGLAIAVTIFAPGGAWGTLRKVIKVDLLPIRRKEASRS